MTTDPTTPQPEGGREAVEALREEFIANGLDSLHGWRCEHPDRYGPCGCVDEFVRDFLASDWLAQRDAQQRAEALDEAAEELEAEDKTDDRWYAEWLRARAEGVRGEGAG